VGDGDVQVVVAELHRFRDDVRDHLLPSITKDPVIANFPGAVGPEALSFLRQIIDFDSALDLGAAYEDTYGSFVSNYTTLVNALSVLAGAADRIADNYRRAQSADTLSAKSVDAVFDSVPVPPPPGPG
jgi:hypothetical protein